MTATWASEHQSPAQKLTVKGNIGLWQNYYIRLHNPTDSYWKIGKDSDHNINVDGYGSGARRFRIRNAPGFVERFSVNLASGDVGIGTSSPQAKLDVKGTIKANAGVAARRRMSMQAKGI